jgi:hypothetical protein
MLFLTRRYGTLPGFLCIVVGVSTEMKQWRLGRWCMERCRNSWPRAKLRTAHWLCNLRCFHTRTGFGIPRGLYVSFVPRAFWSILTFLMLGRLGGSVYANIRGEIDTRPAYLTRWVLSIRSVMLFYPFFCLTNTHILSHWLSQRSIAAVVEHSRKGNQCASRRVVHFLVISTQFSRAVSKCYISWATKCSKIHYPPFLSL